MNLYKKIDDKLIEKIKDDIVENIRSIDRIDRDVK
jgi:hypothetical protein